MTIREHLTCAICGGEFERAEMNRCITDADDNAVHEGCLEDMDGKAAFDFFGINIAEVTI